MSSPEDWGMVASSPEEVARALEWNRHESLERLQFVLEQCRTEEQFTISNQLTFDETRAMIQQKRVLAIDLGEAGTFIPNLQFTDDESVETTEFGIRKDILELGNATFMSPLGFCYYMKQLYKGSLETPLDMFTKGSEEEKEIIRDIVTTQMFM